MSPALPRGDPGNRAERYRVLVAPAAAAALRRLDPATQRRILDALTGLQQTPRPPAAMALPGTPGWLRIRVGDHRIAYEVRVADLAVLVLRISGRDEPDGG